MNCQFVLPMPFYLLSPSTKSANLHPNLQIVLYIFFIIIMCTFSTQTSIQHMFYRFHINSVIDRTALLSKRASDFRSGMKVL